MACISSRSFPVFRLMYCRTLQNSHCWDIELPKHAGVPREAARPVCVSHSLVHEIKRNGWRARKILLSTFPKVALAGALTFEAASTAAACIVFLACEPTLALCSHWGFHRSSPRCRPPEPGSLSWIGHRLRREQGAFWSLLAHSSFFVVVLVGFFFFSEGEWHSYA